MREQGAAKLIFGKSRELVPPEISEEDTRNNFADAVSNDYNFNYGGSLDSIGNKIARTTQDITGNWTFGFNKADETYVGDAAVSTAVYDYVKANLDGDFNKLSDSALRNVVEQTISRGVSEPPRYGFSGFSLSPSGKVKEVGTEIDVVDGALDNVTITDSNKVTSAVQKAVHKSGPPPPPPPSLPHKSKPPSRVRQIPPRSVSQSIDEPGPVYSPAEDYGETIPDGGEFGGLDWARGGQIR